MKQENSPSTAEQNVIGMASDKQVILHCPFVTRSSRLQSPQETLTEKISAHTILFVKKIIK